MSKWIAERLKERSTYRGLALLGAMFGIGVAPDQIEYIVTAGMTLVGVVETITSEHKAG